MILRPINLDTKTRRVLSEKLDPKLIKTRTQFGGGGKNSLKYISANTCIDLLNNAFGHNWSMHIVDRWMEPGIPSPFVEKDGKKPMPQGPTAWCIVQLSVDFTDEDGNVRTITKSAFGSQSITGNQSVQSTNGYKGAQSDALKKAATLFGVALELYRDEDEKIYFKEINEDLFILWTEELKENYIEEWEYIDKVCDENDYEYSDLAYWVAEATGQTYSSLLQMPEEYLQAFIEELKKEGL